MTPKAWKEKGGKADYTQMIQALHQLSDAISTIHGNWSEASKAPRPQNLRRHSLSASQK